jgi:hypothetical protein
MDSTYLSGKKPRIWKQYANLFCSSGPFGFLVERNQPDKPERPDEPGKVRSKRPACTNAPAHRRSVQCVLLLTKGGGGMRRDNSTHKIRATSVTISVAVSAVITNRILSTDFSPDPNRLCV